MLIHNFIIKSKKLFYYHFNCIIYSMVNKFIQIFNLLNLNQYIQLINKLINNYYQNLQ